VASVYLSDKDSVFESEEAHDLVHWLRAVATPQDVRLVRAGLATRTVGLSLDELGWLASDDEAFDARSETIAPIAHGLANARGIGDACVRPCINLGSRRAGSSLPMGSAN